jgi:TolB protein
LRGTDDAGSGVGTSYSQTISFAEEDVGGGLYYWNAPTGQIFRYDFGLRGQRAETFLDPARVGATECVGCHALSRDGRRIAVGLDEPGPSQVKIYDVADRTQLMAFGGGGEGGANFFTFSPDATQLAVSDGSGILIRDTATGSVLHQVDGVVGTMPDWSPDGSHIVYTEPPAGWCDDAGFDEESECHWPLVEGGQIGTLELVSGTWRPGPMLVPRGSENNFYPTYSPDGQWVLFNRSRSNQSSIPDFEGESVLPTDHELWAIAADGGTPIPLGATTSGAGETWPKWDPTAYAHRGQALFWFSFSSTRSYGLRTADGGPSQLWMAAFVPSQAGAGLDPATPPLRLPFQGDEGGNHIAQWVTRVERPSCTDTSECGAGEFCDGGRCLPDGPI